MDLALYYDASGRLGYALWDEWELDSKTGLPDMLTYERTRALEFRYDPDGRQRYMARELDPDELPDIVPLESPKGRWVEYAGVSPYGDAEYTHEDDESFELTRRYEPGAEIDLLEEETLWQHGDLIGSTIAETDDGENTENVQAYTAFGDRIGAGEVNSRYRYGGAWGYESGLLVLEGAASTQPIELLHLGERWYQPDVGRFIQRDAIGIAGGLNVYGYVDGNPVSLIDPTGFLSWSEFWQGETIVHRWVARNVWNRVFSDDYLADMSDGEMYAWGIGTSVVGGCVIGFPSAWGITAGLEWLGYGGLAHATRFGFHQIGGIRLASGTHMRSFGRVFHLNIGKNHVILDPRVWWNVIKHSLRR